MPKPLYSQEAAAWPLGTWAEVMGFRGWAPLGGAGRRGSRRGGFLGKTAACLLSVQGWESDGIRPAWCSGWPCAPQPSSQPQVKSGAVGPVRWPHPGTLTELRCFLEKRPGQPVLGPVLPPPSHRTRPNRGLSSFTLQSGLSRGEHRLLEMLKAAPVFHRGRNQAPRGPAAQLCSRQQPRSPVVQRP